MQTIKSKPIAKNLDRPVFATSAPGDKRRLFVVEQHTGRIRILTLATHKVKPVPFLKISGLPTGNEQGLLGLAFHPKYKDNGFFFVNLTVNTGGGNAATEIRRYRVSPGRPDVADPGSATTLLRIPQPFSNHNGGWLAFGPKDGFLYIGMGDGGSANDPSNRAQNLKELLGKLLRIDVDGKDPAKPNQRYGIPPSNPFVGRANVQPEIWAFGLRNPWRCAFDRSTGDLFIGDVGQDKFEEIDFQLAASPGGENYGWRVKEGLHPTGLGSASGLVAVDPIHEYGHDEGIAVIGGYVYRGTALPALKGTYFFADHNTPIWSFRRDARGVTELTDRTAELFPAGMSDGISSFAEDGKGELYILTLDPGAIYRIVKG